MPRQQAKPGPAAEGAAIAAREMLAGNVDAFGAARRRACEELNLDLDDCAISNLAIHAALITELKLFHFERQQQRIDLLRSIARRALQFFAEFQARLCGPVWYGTALDADPISIHLFCDEVEAVTRLLLDEGIAYQLDDRPFRFAQHKATRLMPVFDLNYADQWLELVVFPSRGQWRTPLSALDNRPLRRFNLRQLDELIAARILFPDAHNAP